VAPLLLDPGTSCTRVSRILPDTASISETLDSRYPTSNICFQSGGIINSDRHEQPLHVLIWSDLYRAADYCTFTTKGGHKRSPHPFTLRIQKHESLSQKNVTFLPLLVSKITHALLTEMNKRHDSPIQIHRPCSYTDMYHAQPQTTWNMHGVHFALPCQHVPRAQDTARL
jgi:hypothetical protein